jgi:hypothetical protein
MSPDPMMMMGGGGMGPSPADYGTMMPGGTPQADPAAQQPSPLLILLMQLMAPSINAASMGGGMMGMPPAAMGGMPSLGQTMQPTAPPAQPPLY